MTDEEALSMTQDMIDLGVFKTYVPPPLLRRCQCGKVISICRAYCNACMNIELAKIPGTNGYQMETK